MAISQAQICVAPFDAIAGRYDETFTTSKIGLAQRGSHVIYKWHRARLNADFCVPFPHHTLIRIPSLMNDTQLYNSFIDPFESFENPNV